MLMGIFAGCGGGGGGGGGFPIISAAALTTTVSINGAAASADSSGQYAVKPGDTVEITASSSSDWASTSAQAGAVTLRNPSVTPTKWAAQVVNTQTSQSTYTVTAKASANSALTKDTVLKVAGGDTRNGEYTVFSTNGSQLKLALNFNTQTYDMTDAGGGVASNVFAADTTEAGTFVFKSERIVSPVNTARFRMAADTVVGSFPFTTAATPTAFAVQPFIASRALVTQQSALDGVYNRFGIQVNATSRNSQIRQTVVTNAGTMMLSCSEIAIEAIANCPSGSLLRYTVSPGTNSWSWNLVNVADPTDKGAVSIAVVGGQNVYLAAGPNTTGSNVFRIGLPETTAWTYSVARGADTNGTWGTLTLDATTGVSSLLKPDGTAGSIGYGLGNMGTLGPLGMRGSGAPPNAYFLMQGVKLSVVVGAQGNNAGYIQLGLQD